MTRMEVIILDAGLLGRALWPLNNFGLLVLAFGMGCLFVMSATHIGYLLYNSDLVWDLMSPIARLILSAGTGLVMVLAASIAGLFLLPLGNPGTNLYQVNRAIRSKLRGSEKWGAVTLAKLFATVLSLCIIAGVFIPVAIWNQRYQPGMTALTAAVIGLVLLVIGFLYFLPSLMKRLYFGRHAANDQNRDFILLLRSFKGDALHTRARPFTQGDSIEGMVTDMLERFTTVIAVSDPRDATQPLGAERLALKTMDWQPRVLDLMNRAAAIVMVLDNSPGVTWELDRILEQGRLSKTIFVVWAQERGWLEGAWTELLERIGGQGLVAAPDRPRNKVALAATCSNDLVSIAVASANTPLNCGLAVSTLLYLSIFKPSRAAA